MPHKIELIKGVEGRCICIDGYRIAGPKPWGGGNVVQTWNVDNLGPVETGIRASAFREAVEICNRGYDRLDKLKSKLDSSEYIEAASNEQSGWLGAENEILEAAAKDGDGSKPAANKTSFRRCGECVHWMKTSDCPRESKGLKPSAGDWACIRFQADPLRAKED